MSHHSAIAAAEALAGAGDIGGKATGLVAPNRHLALSR